MSPFALFVGGMLPYVTVLVFVAGMAYRFHTWASTPQPSKMALFGRDGRSTAGAVVEEVLLFPSLFRGDRALWSMAWVFHATLALVVLGHVRVFSSLGDEMLLALGMSAAGIDGLSAFAGGAAGVVLLATALLLFVRRASTPRVREISRPPDFLALALLMAIIATGDVMRFGSQQFDLGVTRVWAQSLLALSPVVPVDNWFLLHALLAQTLVIFIPFSKILHFGGVFFTQTLVKVR